MTIRWCAYCQEFLGETAPFESLDLSHGMCVICARKGLDLSRADLTRAKLLSEIQEDLRTAGKHEASNEEVIRLIQKATEAGVKPIDILMGFVTQLLRFIGKKWELGEVSVAEEHRYTIFCERILGHIEAALAQGVSPAPASRVKILVLNAPGNFHTLGTRISAVWLNSHGISAKAIYPRLPPGEVPNLLREYSPKFLGISISLPDQAPAVEEILTAIRGSNLPSSPQVILGGFAVKQSLVPAIPGTTQAGELREILDFLRA